MINRTAWLAPALMALSVASWVACSGSSPVSPVNSTPGPSPTAQVQATPTPEPTPTPTPSASPSGDPGFAGPSPEATPASCPMLTSWYSTIHNITDTNQQPTKVPVVGGAVVIDSTPLFEGRACNLEHDHCGGRHCEDPRGGEWTLLVGTSESEVRGEGYQFRIGPLKEGPHRWRVCPLRDAHDGEGVPLQTGQFACTEGVFTVLTSPPPAN